MKNSFFNKALSKANIIVGQPGRLLQLAGIAAQRIYKVEKKHVLLNNFKNQLFTFGRLINSYARGQYRAVPLKTILKITAAVLYFINPLDLIPDALVGVGLVDDVAVLTWVYRSSLKELDNFLSWEMDRRSTDSRS